MPGRRYWIFEVLNSGICLTSIQTQWPPRRRITLKHHDRGARFCQICAHPPILRNTLASICFRFSAMTSNHFSITQNRRPILLLMQAPPIEWKSLASIVGAQLHLCSRKIFGHASMTTSAKEKPFLGQLSRRSTPAFSPSAQSDCAFNPAGAGQTREMECRASSAFTSLGVFMETGYSAAACLPLRYSIASRWSCATCALSAFRHPCCPCNG